MYPRLIALILLAQGSGSAFAGWLDDPLPQAEPAAQPAPQAEAQTQPGLTAPSPLIEVRREISWMPTVVISPFRPMICGNVSGVAFPCQT